jgi:hypothetical protein
MPQATCRCGQKLSVPANGPDRVICPKCSARVRVRRDEARSGPGDGYVRFNCQCGRRLKVRSGTIGSPAQHAGRCPDCGRVVSVPSSSSSQSLKAVGEASETRTEELSAGDIALLEQWSQGHLTRAKPGAANGQGGQPAAAPLPKTELIPAPAPALPMTPPIPAPVKIEAGLRVCPRCGRPIHLGAETCRDCGAHVPRR